MRADVILRFLGQRVYGFPERLSLSLLGPLGIISILCSDGHPAPWRAVLAVVAARLRCVELQNGIAQLQRSSIYLVHGPVLIFSFV